MSKENVEIKEGMEGAKEFLAKNPAFEVPFEFCFTGDESSDTIETLTAVTLIQSMQKLTPKQRGNFLKNLVVHNASRDVVDNKDASPYLKTLFLRKLREGK